MKTDSYQLINIQAHLSGCMRRTIFMSREHAVSAECIFSPVHVFTSVTVSFLSVIKLKARTLMPARNNWANVRSLLLTSGGVA